MEIQNVRFLINGRAHEISIKPNTTLLEVLRNRLNLTGTKLSCGIGSCGACTVLIDGKPTNSCITLAITAREKQIQTIEGLAKIPNLHPIQKAFIDHGAIQCGFCTPGMILSAKALLDRIPNPTKEEIKEALAGNLCRCTGYVKIINAVSAAAELMRRED